MKNVVAMDSRDSQRKNVPTISSVPLTSCQCLNRKRSHRAILERCLSCISCVYTTISNLIVQPVFTAHKRNRCCISPIMPGIVDLPEELVVDVLLPVLPNRDLASLASTSKLFARLCNDDTFWRRKCDKDFNFDGANTARKTGWKFIYKGLTKPKAYVWGYATIRLPR